MRWQTEFLEKHTLLKSYPDNVQCVLDWLEQVVSKQKGPFCLAINGAQGSGKSTLSAYLKAYLDSQGITTEIVSLDDFYLSKAQRVERATQYHPLFNVRGVPGTHDISFAIEQVKRFKNSEDFILPRFNKAIDEPYSTDRWLYCKNKPKVLIFEGWCLGLLPQSEAQLNIPMNNLETTQDSNGKYRVRVNQFLSDEYQALFALFDKLVFLNAQSFERVYSWRLQQEHQLIKRAGTGMSDEAVTIFIQYFERLTRWGIESLSARSDLHIKLDENRQFSVAT
ncbi:kinase [Pseudoalteromonas phenolica]|uniref:kinase n=1 Tax=Pseudoalteromonas phenolica TaxID=161398 RepID=UPI00110B3254|nr:kinase [Pseudoalteromonas phenolica]TMO53373.1 kinase [Pseudoalteromonas phenolica]